MTRGYRRVDGIRRPGHAGREYGLLSRSTALRGRYKTRACCGSGLFSKIRRRFLELRSPQGRLSDSCSMTRRITQTLHGSSVPEVLTTIDGNEHCGIIRAYAIDDDPHTNEGYEHWALVQCDRARGRDYLRWLPTCQVKATSSPTVRPGFFVDNVLPLRGCRS